MSLILTGRLVFDSSKRLERYVSVECDLPYPHSVIVTIEATDAQKTDDELTEALERFLQADTVRVEAEKRYGCLYSTIDRLTIIGSGTELMFDTPNAGLPDPILTFGKHRGEALSKVPDHYRLWLSNPTGRDGKPYRVDPEIVEAAKAWIANDTTPLVRQLMAGVADLSRPTVYVIDRDSHHGTGDTTLHRSLADALAYLEHEFPMATSEDFDGETRTSRTTPDPEDDLILIWEVLPTGHRKVVWQFAGWHHSADDYACGQGRLPSDEEDLYTLATRDY